jgi:hypothetical protein
MVEYTTNDSKRYILKSHQWRYEYGSNDHRSVWPGARYKYYYCTKCGSRIKCYSDNIPEDCPEYCDFFDVSWTLTCEEVIVKQIHDS